MPSANEIATAMSTYRLGFPIMLRRFGFSMAGGCSYVFASALIALLAWKRQTAATFQ